MNESLQQHGSRQHARARVDLFVNKISESTPHLMRVRDLSAGGMYLQRLLDPEREGMKEFNVEMQLPGQDDLMWVTVEVVRKDCRGDDIVGYGVRFSHLSDADKQMIDNFVRQQPMQLSSSVQRMN